MSELQWRALRVGVFVCAIVIVALAMNWLRTKPQARGVVTKAPEQPHTQRPPAPISFEEISETYQGPLQLKDKDEGWMALTIHANGGAAETIAFRYRFNVFTLAKKDLSGRGDDGELSIARGTIRFGEYQGRLRRDGRGRVILQSNPIDGPPYWLLEPVTSTSLTPNE